MLYDILQCIFTQKKKLEGYTALDINTINILISFMHLFAIKKYLNNRL